MIEDLHQFHIRNLINEGAHLLIHDPKVSPSQITKDLELEPLTENLNSIEDNNNGSWEYITNLEDSFTKLMQLLF